MQTRGYGIAQLVVCYYPNCSRFEFSPKSTENAILAEGKIVTMPRLMPRCLVIITTAVLGCFSDQSTAQQFNRMQICEVAVNWHTPFGKYVFANLRHLIESTDPESEDRRAKFADIQEQIEKYRDRTYSSLTALNAKSEQSISDSGLSDTQKRLAVTEARLSSTIVEVMITPAYQISAQMAQNSRIRDFEEARFRRMLNDDCMTLGTNR